MHLKTKISLGTPAMINAGIKASCQVLVASAEGKPPIFGLNNFLFRLNKEKNSIFSMPPSEPFYLGATKCEHCQGRGWVGGERRWKRIITIGPDEEGFDGPIQTKFNTFMLEKYNEALNTAKEQQTQPAAAEPATVPADPGPQDEADF